MSILEIKDVTYGYTKLEHILFCEYPSDDPI